VRRQRGALDSKVTIIINFNTPVRPEFSLYDIDGYLSAFERVTVTGECAGGTMIPDLSYAGSPSSSSYKINSNVATATAARALSPTDKNGQVNVSFREGVKKIIIEYAITNRIPPTWQINDLIISPIRLRQIPPPPPLNEDGLSFVKDVKSREITTCDPVEYTFYIQNVNCDPKYVHFRDTLPDKMKWEDGLGMDSINAYENTHIRFNSYEGNAILHIDSLLVPGAGTLILTATAILDKDAVPQGDTVRFDNHARIKYKQWVENVELDRELKSVDRETLAEETWFEAAWSIRQETIPTDITVDKDYYNADSERTVTITLDNPSDDPITDSYLDLLFDAGFTYVANSFESSIISSPAPVAVTSATDSTLLIAGVTSGASGFTIPPSGTSTFKFKLRAPAAANLVHAIDENNQETNDIADLNIEYLFISEMDDPCIIRSMTDMSGSKQVPYRWASDDDTTTIPGKPIKIPVLDNDSIPTGCTPTVKITEGPKIAGATATVVNDSILYFPGNDCVGDRFDTLIYRARCTNSIDSSWAYVYIKIDKAPDVYPAGDISIITSGNSLIVAIGIVNKGDSAIGPPVHMTLYKEKVAPENKITGGSASYDIKIAPDDTSYISITIPNDTITKHAIAHIVARINDNDGAFPYWEECDTTNNKISMVNTLLNESMKKNAFPKGSLTTQNGAYSNPVSILFGDTIEYQIMVENPVDEDIVICDTLPPYMNYVDGSANPPPDVNPPLKTAGNPQRTILSWTLTNIRPPRPNNLAEITFEATPALGSNASQPLYINQAWVTVDNTIVVPTSSTYHQGTGTCTVTFSTGHGGSIYNADPQVIDYSTSANAGVLVAPDEGHRFIGWSYDDYVSYRGELIKGGSGVIHYDTLAVFGNVELRANFELNNYPIRYHLNEGINAESNPETYTVKSGTITLEAPRKAGDEFVGWTGSNGEELQKTVTIPVGSTGEREYYANFMYSGREDGVQDMPTDKIWSAGNEVYIRTSQTGSVVRIYTPDGILRKQHTILSSGITKFKLDPGVYILTLNNSVGQKVVINQ
jgi:uncharacterized repeat protein (TIGR02543 family)/uncharacterized repeat protein (TIGR01451 family)